MTAFSSIEVRWFIQGDLNPDSPLVQWFRATEPFPRPSGPPRLEWPEGRRRDTYLVLPDRPEIGIKLRREGIGSSEIAKLEFKGRTESLGLREIVPGGDGSAPVLGKVERWTKWSIPAAEAGLDGAGVIGGDARAARGPLAIAVGKRRLLRMARIGRDGSVEEIADPTARIERGIGFELTRIDVAGAPWSSLAFEAFPSSIDPEDEFLPIVRAWMAGVPRREVLEPDHSFGYPALLERVYR